ncbi:hypothetical protein VMCG_02007 [Cytospora schulzeri]|uniref:Protein kinase domain-containing protein n=1 Tax=Cytospora schulzeri TaxID=448051 RepID=A0A423X3I4_9PEZI|nr:hypothetical protein VMCG_02007 [Valsa malicola]
MQDASRYGEKLKHACSALKHADDEISERVLRLENGWLRFEHQLEFARRIQYLMGQEHQEVFHKTLVMFLSKLEIVTSMLMSLLNSDGTFRAKMKYVWKKDSLDEAIEGLEVWQRMSDHSWFLLMRISDPDVDTALATDDSNPSVATTSTSAIRAGLSKTSSATVGSGLCLDYGGIASMAVRDVSFSEARIATKIHHSGAVSSYILNEIVTAQPPGGSGKKMVRRQQRVKKDTRELARRLQHDDPETFGLLACKGFSMDPVGLKLTLVFRVPPSLGGPRSLRDLLLNTENPKSLTQHFDLAKDLAKSVGYVHTFGFVHKNIRPESVLIFSSPGGRSLSTFLVGLDDFRRDEGYTERIGDSFIERNLYRHPSRQGSSPTWDYIMQHDIYSLGVCLLEMGLWKSLIEYPEIDGETTPQWSSVLGMPKDLNPLQAIQYLCSDAKQKLLCLAQDELPRSMGTKYTDIVVTCLTCLDPENGDFGDEEEFQDEDGICVGVRYIEKVLLRLNALNVSDVARSMTLSGLIDLTPSNYSDCVASLRTSVSLLESSVETLGNGVTDFPRLSSVLKTVRHYELIPQPTLAAAESSLRDEIGPFVSHLLDRADRQTERQARRIETLKARSDLNAGRLGRAEGSAGGLPLLHPASASASAPALKRRRSARKTLDGGAGLRARAVRQRKEALKYGVERLEMEVAQKERELRLRLQEA